MTALHIAGLDDIEKLLPLVAALHAHEEIEQADETRRAALLPLLEGTPHGVIYIIGPRTSPVGYIAISFGYSIELGGIDGTIDEFYIRERVRGRGMGTEVLLRLLPALETHGIVALNLEVANDNTRARALYARAGFEPRDKYSLMTRTA